MIFSNLILSFFSESISESKVFLAWKSNDGSVIGFELQFLDLSVNDSYWSTIYQDSQSQWPISGLTNGIVQFRVRAKNAFGWSDWSQESTSLDLEKILDQQYQKSQVYITIFSRIKKFRFWRILFLNNFDLIG